MYAWLEWEVGWVGRVIIGIVFDAYRNFQFQVILCQTSVENLMLGAAKINEALELVATIRKRCLIAQAIALHSDTNLLYIVFEDIAADSQELLEYCIDFEEEE